MTGGNASEPIDGPLIPRHASKRKSGTWGPDDWDVVCNGRDVGRILIAIGINRPLRICLELLEVFARGGNETLNVIPDQIP